MSRTLLLFFLCFCAFTVHLQFGATKVSVAIRTTILHCTSGTVVLTFEPVAAVRTRYAEDGCECETFGFKAMLANRRGSFPPAFDRVNRIRQGFPNDRPWGRTVRHPQQNRHKWLTI